MANNQQHDPRGSQFVVGPAGLAVSAVAGVPPTGGSVLNINGAVAQGSTVSISPVSGGFGDFDGEIVQYLRGDEASAGTPIHGVTPSIGSQAPVTTYVTGIGSDPAGQHLTFNNAEVRPGRTMSLQRNNTDEGTLRAGGFGYSSGARDDPQLYVSYWKHFSSDAFDPLQSNYKEFYIFSNGTDSNSITEKPQPIFVSGSRDSSMRAGNNVGIAGNIYNTAGWSIPSTIASWKRREMFIKLNDPGVANGVFNLWIDRAKGVSNEAYKMQPDSMQAYATGFKGVRLGYYDSGIPNAFINHSDYYVSTTPARVEMGNASTWSACTHTELQLVLPGNWSNTLISDITLDAGALLTHVGRYLYVIKSDGAPFHENGELLA